MTRRPFLEAARAGPVLGDGAMGTRLQKAGLEPGACGELWNLEHPERVLAIQREYAEAGARFLLTNTFGGSRMLLARHGADDRVEEVNLAGASIARRAAGPDRWVLGDIGPFGGFLEPLGDAAEEEVTEAFRTQARALVMGGVDGILVETMSALEEATLAVRVAREAGAPFVLATMAFDATAHGPRTMMGVSPEDAARSLLAAGADGIGTNCGTGLWPEGYLAALRELREAAPHTLLVVQPNAGQPRLDGPEVVYDAEPEEMAGGLRRMMDAGARIVGGCCGTTPEHIEAFAQLLGGR